MVEIITQIWILIKCNENYLFGYHLLLMDMFTAYLCLAVSCLVNAACFLIVSPLCSNFTAESSMNTIFGCFVDFCVYCYIYFVNKNLDLIQFVFVKERFLIALLWTPLKKKKTCYPLATPCFKVWLCHFM